MSKMTLTKREALSLIDYFGNDGHGIYHVDKVAEATGVPESKLERWAHTHKSDSSSHKSTIYGNDGKPITELRGVYALSVVRSIGNVLEIYSDMNGRGSMARDLSDQIKKAFADTDLDQPLMG